MNPLPMETARLILRPFEDRDAPEFARYRSDPDVARYQGWNIPYTLEHAEQFVKEMRAMTPGTPGEWFQVALEQKTAPGLVGDIAYQVLAEDHRQGEIGFTLAREYQGQGYATEAVTALLDFLFRHLGLHRVRADIDPMNHASARLLSRLGMRHEGRFIEIWWLKGAWVSEDWYAILRREWLARNQ